MNSQSVYTPQFIINGEKTDFGYQFDSILKTIDKELEKKAQAQVRLQVDKKDNRLRIKYSLNDVPKDYLLNIALVERNLKTYIPKGENIGKTLLNENVVRKFENLIIKD